MVAPILAVNAIASLNPEAKNQHSHSVLLDLPLIIFEFHSPHVVVIGEFQTDEIALRKVKMKE